ncbi:cytochrome P450 [Neoconidiobolus thromboides FSU 785]|nr:cytochrome P450 [Neoconidiobolus thromboides FSU 785]
MSIITVLNLILISFGSLILIIYLIILKKPGKLSHLPSKSIFQCLKCMFSNKPRDVKHKTFIQKDLNKYKLLTLFEYGAWEIIVNCPKTARMILNDTVNFPKEIPMDNFPNSLFAKYMGKNIVYSNGDDWKKYRKIGQRVFKKKFSTSLFHSIILNFIKKVEQANRSINTSVDVYKYMQKITMDSLGKGVMGVDFNSVENENVAFIAAYNQIIRESLNPFYLLFSIFDTPRNPFRNSSYQCLYLIEDYFSKILTEKRNKIIKDNNMKDNNNDDILTLMIKANLNNEILFSDKEIRDNIMIYILAGHDTTSFILSATLHYLAQNPDIQEKARKEVMELMELKKYNNCKELDEIQFPNSEQVKGMKYLLAIIKETIRLYPAVPRLTTRINKKEFKVNGFHIPKDCSINLDLFYIHRDNDNFKDADKFIPERFLNEKDSKKKNISKSVYFNSDNENFFGFGGGSKFCIGSFFSILEQKLVLSILLTRYSISYPPNSPQANGAPLLLTSNFLLLTKDLYLNFRLLS